METVCQCCWYKLSDQLFSRFSNHQLVNISNFNYDREGGIPLSLLVRFMKSIENRDQVKNDRATSEMFVTSLSIIIILYFYAVGRNGLKANTHSCTQ